MPRTFRDDLAADLANAFLDVNGFGETVTYYPKDGVSREIAANVVRGKVRGQARSSTARQVHQSENRLEQTDECTVTCRVHETLGMYQPQLGDALVLADDAPGARWDYCETLQADVAFVTRWTKTKVERSGRSRPMEHF